MKISESSVIRVTKRIMEVFCSQLNDDQKCFFVTYIMKCKITFKNNEEEPDQFCPHLTGEAGVKL